MAKDLSEAKYRCRHGLSYTVYESEYDGLASSQTMVIPRGENVLLWDVKVKNTTDAVRDLSLFTYMEFSFHHIMIDNQNFQMSQYCAGSSYEDGIIEEDLFYEEKGYQYLTASFVIMLGEGNREEGRRIRVKYSDLKRVDAVYTDLAAYWKQKYDALQIRTPNEGMQAKMILIMACGADKKEIVKKAFQGPICPQVPASVLQLHGNVILVGDEACLG